MAKNLSQLTKGFSPERLARIAKRKEELSTGFIYLAAPYTDKDPKVQRQRYTAVLAATAYLMGKGIVVFSPLSHTVPLEELLPEAEHKEWMKQDLALLAKADALYVLTLYGWHSSSGVQEEVEFAHKHGIPVSYYTITELAEVT